MKPPDRGSDPGASQVPGLDELAKQQGVEAVSNLDEISALWPVDDDPDELLQHVLREREARRTLADGGRRVGMKPLAATNDEKIVYLAGPMRGLPNFNFHAFEDAKERLERCGFGGKKVRVISPTAIDRAWPLRAQTEDMARGVYEGDYRTVVLRDVMAICGLDPERDAVAVLPGWETSRGCLAEVAVARWLGVPVFDAITGARQEAE